MFFQTWRERRQARKQIRDLQARARHLLHLRGDLMSAADTAALKALAAAAGTAGRAADAAAMQRASEALDERLAALTPPYAASWWRENFEVLVVAIGVAMAFRCYVLQPFKIPTGSMQPTLYGISSREQAEPSWLDRLPAKPVHWFLSGEWYRKVEVLEGGPVVLLERDDRHPGYLTLAVRGRRYYVPADAWRDRQALRVRPSDPGTPLRIPGVGPVLGRAEPGDVLWAGVAVAGDHVFVNRVSWNFRRPRRGEVMVFSTDGIRDLPQGTHYIKRLVGLPGERLWIDPPWVFADGRRVEAPETIARVARGERLAPWAPPYAGYQTIGLQQESSHPQALRRPGDTVKLPADGYYAMGDNTLNSRDSRYWGWVPERNLLGPAAFVYWPFFSPRLGPIR